MKIQVDYNWNRKCNVFDVCSFCSSCSSLKPSKTDFPRHRIMRKAQPNKQTNKKTGKENIFWYLWVFFVVVRCALRNAIVCKNGVTHTVRGQANGKNRAILISHGVNQSIPSAFGILVFGIWSGWSKWKIDT